MAAPWEKYQSEGGPWQKYGGVKDTSPPPGPIERFVSNAAEQANPVNLLRGIGETVMHPIEAAKGYLKQNEELADRTKKSFRSGEYMEGLRHGLNLLMQAVPGLGMASDEAGEQINRGDVAGGLGKAAGAGLAMVEGAYLPKAARGTARAVDATARGARTAAAVATDPAVIRAGIEAIPVVGEPIAAVYNAAKASAARQRAPAPAPAPPVPSAAPALPVEMAPAAAPGPVARPGAPMATGGPALPKTMPSGPVLDAIVEAPAPAAPIGPIPEGITPGQWASIQQQYAPAIQGQIVEAVRRKNTGGRISRIAPVEGGTQPAPAPPHSAAIDAPAPSESVTSPAPARGKGIAQASKDARALADKLIEWKFTPDEAGAMNERGWAKLAHDSDIPMPTEATRKSALFDMKKKLAGPPRTLPELYESLRESLGMDPAPQKIRSILDKNPNAKPADAARIIAEELKAEMERSGTVPAEPAPIVEISKPKTRRTKK